MTEPKNPTLAQMVSDLGGVTKVAAQCGVTESAVRHWMRKGRVPTTAAYLLHTLHPQYSSEELIGK